MSDRKQRRRRDWRERLLEDVMGEEVSMRQGKIDHLNEKRFGFIVSHGERIFFHQTDLQGVLWQDLKKDDLVEFETTHSPRGLRATVVRKLEAGRK